MNKQMQTVEQEVQWNFPRVEAEYKKGLTTDEVEARMSCGAHNAPPEGVTASVGKIVTKNVVTPFNIINLMLALAVILVGHPRNALFFLIAIINTCMGIFQELRAKKTLDKLSILAKGKVAAVRNGVLVGVPQDNVVLDDILLLESGQQVCADAVVVAAGGMEVDESLLTGESDHIVKKAGDLLLSGSYIVAGQGYARVSAVGAQSYAGRLSVNAKKEKNQNAPLLRVLNNIIRVLAIAIVPIGLLLFFNQYSGGDTLVPAVLGSAAAMVGMIPEGLILLTGITLTLGALKLAQRKALVQSLPSIETLARADVLCLDKTGTITDGTLSFEEIYPLAGASTEEIGAILGELMTAINDDNSTARALREVYPEGGALVSTSRVPFSSKRKWSAASFEEKGSYVLGAPRFVFPDVEQPWYDVVTEYATKGMRVLVLAHTDEQLPEKGLPNSLEPVALIVLSDTVRAEAPETFRFFASEGVTLKVISGDDALTVSTIAQKADIEGAEKYIDVSQLPKNVDYRRIAKDYVVFGRVAPEQKRMLVKALKENGQTVCMTGDGVNDVLALKESDCGVAMISGSEAARGASDFVLMTSDFSAMIDVFKEGRQVINNIENVASLYLVKTIYSIILSLLYVFIQYPYPFTPLQMTPINSLTVGIPSFFLALRPNHKKPEGRFLMNVLEVSLPAAISVVINILLIQLAGYCFNLSHFETSTMNVFVTGAICFMVLVKVAGKKAGKWEKGMIVALGVCFLGAFVVLGGFFGLDSLFTRNAFFYMPLAYFGVRSFNFFAVVVKRINKERLAFGSKSGQTEEAA